MKSLAIDFALSDTGQALGLKNLPEEGSKIGTLAENILRVSHWIPVVGSATSLISLAILNGKVSSNSIPDEERSAEYKRLFFAFLGGSVLLMAIDLAVTGLRQSAPEEIAPHKLFANRTSYDLGNPLGGFKPFPYPKNPAVQTNLDVHDVTQQEAASNEAVVPEKNQRKEDKAAEETLPRYLVEDPWSEKNEGPFN